MQRIVVIGSGSRAERCCRTRCAEKADIRCSNADRIFLCRMCASYYVSGIVKDRRKMLVVTPEEFRARHNVDLRATRSCGCGSGRQAGHCPGFGSGQGRSVSVRCLILATGANPFVPPIPGAKLPNIFTLRTVPDADRIREMIATKGQACGGGRGWSDRFGNGGSPGGAGYPVVVELFEHVLPPLDTDMAYLVEKLRKRRTIVTGDAVTESLVMQGVEWSDQKQAGIGSQLVIMSVGVRPNVELAVQAGWHWAPMVPSR